MGAEHQHCHREIPLDLGKVQKGFSLPVPCTNLRALAVQTYHADTPCKMRQAVALLSGPPEDKDVELWVQKKMV